MTDENTERQFSIRLTATNVQAFRESAAELRATRDEVIHELQRYPLEVRFAEHRFVFSDVRELDAFIDQAENALRAFDEKRPKVTIYWPNLGSRNDLVRALATIVEAVDPTITWDGVSAEQVSECVVTTLAERKKNELQPISYALAFRLGLCIGFTNANGFGLLAPKEKDELLAWLAQAEERGLKHGT